MRHDAILCMPGTFLLDGPSSRRENLQAGGQRAGFYIYNRSRPLLVIRRGHNCLGWLCTHAPTRVVRGVSPGPSLHQSVAEHLRTKALPCPARYLIQHLMSFRRSSPVIAPPAPSVNSFSMSMSCATSLSVCGRVLASCHQRLHVKHRSPA